MSTSLLRVIEAFDPQKLACGFPCSSSSFLRELGGPTLLRLSGRRRGVPRLISTLLHGNEESGLEAFIAWLARGVTPLFDTWVLIGGVEAALAPPGFAYRSLPGRPDLNRLFRPPFEGPDGRLAREVLEQIAKIFPSLVVDLHNNTGASPAYALSPRVGDAELSLLSHFTDCVVHAPLQLGTLVEATQDLCPSVVLECGQVGSAEAVRRAALCLEAVLEKDNLELASGPVRILGDPVRVELLEGAELVYGVYAERGASLVMASDLDRYNFCELRPGSQLGFLHADAPWPFRALDMRGRDISRELLVSRPEVAGPEIVPRAGAETGSLVRIEVGRAFIPVMATTSVAAALADCLFYAAVEHVRRRLL